MSNKSNSRGFDQDAGSVEVQAQYKAASTELPPPSLDASILQAAHVALNSASENNPVQKIESRRRKSVWYVPVSAVAIIVLSLSVVMKLAFEPELSAPMAIEADAMDTLETDASSQQAETQMNSDQQRLDRHRLMQKAEMAKQQKYETRRQHKLSSKPVQLTRVKKSQPAALNSQSSQKQMSKHTQLPADTSAAEKTLPPAAHNNMKSFATLATVPLENNRQTQIDELMRLYENRQLEQLKLALIEYRKEFPVIENTDDLPEKLRQWELREKARHNSQN